MQRRDFLKGAASLGAFSLRNTRAQPATATPANRIRAISRLFCSDVEDKPWFYDRAMWPEYFSMLAANRFNRFHLAFGIGYDFLREVTDAYFLFFYPFVVSVPGFSVRASGVSDGERDRNLETLHYITEQAARHLAETRVRTVGVDYLSVGGYHEDGALIHRILLEAGIWIIEGLNLSAVTAGSYELICLPLRIDGGDASLGNR